MTKAPEPPKNLPAPSLNPNAEVVLAKRYLRKGEDGKPTENPAGMFWRVAANIAAEEGKYENSPWRVRDLAGAFYDLMTSYRFLPNSPTLMNAGTPLGQLAACFVLPVGDSMGEIFDGVKHAAMIHKSGGGTGFSFSRLRPKNSMVGSTGGVASGPVSFMKIFNTATEQVKQGGARRGANMGILRVDHPDIHEFITAKERETELNNFNISVALTEEFMKAVEKDAEYELRAPHTKEVVEKAKAKEVFELLAQKAWESGDPGIVFLDRINRDNPTPEQGEIESTNPCVTADTFVLTTQGPRRVAELVGRRFTAVVSGRPYDSGEHGFFATGRKEVFSLKTREGHSIRLTADHPVLRAASITRKSIAKEWVPAGDLSPGDKIVLGDHRELGAWPGKHGADEGYLIGLLVGDGTLKKDKAVISVWPEQKAANGESTPNSVMNAALECAQALPYRSDFKGWRKIEGRGEYRLSLARLKAVCEDLGMAPGNKTITPQLEECSSDFCSAFISGLFDADGSVQGAMEKGVSIRLAQSDLHGLQAVQRILLRLGISSTIYQDRRPSGEAVLPDGKGGARSYPTRAQHELVIAKDNLIAFAERIGFRDEKKNARLQTAVSSYSRGAYRERFMATFDSLTAAGEEEVYDVRIPGANCFDANGLVAHNCGEQPLLPYEACNLGSINLAKFHDPGAKDGIGWDGLEETIALCVRFLDDVIDASRYPLPEIEEKVRKNRKIGLGVMGWADLLFQLGVSYDSQAALDLGERMMRFIRDAAWSASKELAAERGPFPAYEQSVYAKRNLGPYRNATVTTIAPTGTLSIIAGCSSGVEPLFALSFSRHVLDGEKLVEVNPHFEQALRDTESWSKALMQDVAEKGTVRDMDHVPEDIRRVFVTAMDVRPIWHLKMQAAFQKHTDNAVSKTVNLPNEATVEEIREIYRSAYEYGCKGVTVYRSGCKSAQVLCTGDGAKKEGKEVRNGSVVRSRPDVVYGFTRKMETGLGTLYLTVNEADNRPFEVFATIGKSGRSVTAKAEAIGRLVSLALRSNVPVADIVEQLEGIGGEHPVFQRKGMVLSIPDAIAKVFSERYLGRDRLPKQGSHLAQPTCPDCGGELVFQEGCYMCAACGFTKCG
jgi:ribonucleoside-diphosphate reductase alpha chain